MGRFRRRMYEEYAQEYSNDERYNIAYRKVKRIKGFYTHLRVYVIINVIIIASNMNHYDIFKQGILENPLFDWRTYSTAMFWGIGLMAHALSVFGRDLFFSNDWEEKKIQQYMKKEEAQNKWE
ncbi:2TM domain-containing protein [Flavobacterium sp. MC2016-06]|uniref:2TM domain-containing protein n=1 Tax=Flavobacterium sp. MC2016-06 TaxID=2676308 RepID=UPI0012BA7B3B|nr:2TM domain-containing protein [Flavobacterium sp. MC2016-06]MBU3861980.1 2TM domain-containing protein [Flavobacterium sp. MC2016-06]